MMIRLMSLLLLLLSMVKGCGTTYELSAPSNFSKYPQEDEQLQLISPEGVKLMVREEENYPRGPLNFWVQAIKAQLSREGYLERQTVPIKEMGARPAGVALSFVLPHEGEDWGYLIVPFVDGDYIVLVEMIGPMAHFEMGLSAVLEQLKTLRWMR